MKSRRMKLMAMMLSAAMLMTQTFSTVSVFAEEQITTEDPATAEEMAITDELASDAIAEEILSEGTEEAILEDQEDLDISLTENSEPEAAEEEIFIDSEEVELEEDAELLSVLEEETVESKIVKAYPVDVAVVNDQGAPSGMYAMDDAFVFEAADGSKIVRMHQVSENRNVMALTDDKAAAQKMEDEWIIADEQYYYTLGINDLNDTVTAVFSSTDRISQGKEFGNPMYISFTKQKTYAANVQVVNGEGTASGMYAMDNVVVTEQEDGTYLVRMQQAKKNRDILAITESKYVGTTHGVTWYQADADYVFTIPVTSLDKKIPLVFSSQANVKAGKEFSNPMYLIFDQTAFDSTTAKEVTAAEIQTVAETREALEVVNNTGMFKVASAIVDQSKDKKVLYLALNSTGYEDIMIGTYEEATATTVNPEAVDQSKWLHYELNAEGKYEFVIPLEDGQTYLPIASLSASNAKNGIYKWYPRQVEINLEAGTLEAGDYDHTITLDKVNMEGTILADASFSLRTIGGPLSNGYQEILTIENADIEAADYLLNNFIHQEGTAIEIEKGKITMPVRVNEKGGVLLFDLIGETLTYQIKTTSGHVEDISFVIDKEKKTAEFESSVIPNATVKLTSKGSTKIANGKKVQLQAEVAASGLVPTDVTWSSSNTKVATVDEKGLVTMKKDGAGKSVTITASVYGSKATIKLYNMKGYVTKITLSGSKSVKKGKSITLKAKVATKGGTANKSLKWTSSNTAVATVSSKGKVIGKKKGTVTITAKATDGSGKKVSKKITVK